MTTSPTKTKTDPDLFTDAANEGLAVMRQVQELGFDAAAKLLEQQRHFAARLNEILARRTAA